MQLGISRAQIFLLFAVFMFWPAVNFVNVTMGTEYTKMARGKFTSGSTHGHVELLRRNDAWFIRFEEDFVHDGSPDPWIALGKGGFLRSGIVGELKQFSGRQTHPVLGKSDLEKTTEIYIWCVQHNTSVGRAKLEWFE